MDFFAQAGIERMKLYMDFASKRQQVISSNIANIETPGYEAKDLKFEEIFRGELSQSKVELQRSDTRHRGSKPVLLREEDEVRPRRTFTDSLGNDLNNVDLDREMSQLAENVLKFSAVAQMTRLKLGLVRSAIREGR